MNSIQASLTSATPQKQKDIDRAKVQSLLRHPDSLIRPLILVEGADDIPFYKRVLGVTDWRFTYVRGCSIVIEFLTHFNPSHSSHLCGIIDADFMRLNTDITPFPDATWPDNLFVTDAHDWESMVINQSSINAAWAHIIGPTAPCPEDLSTRIKEGIRNLTYIKWYHSRVKEGQNGLDFGKSSMEAHYGRSISDSLNYIYSHQGSDDKIAITPEEVESFKSSHLTTEESNFFVGHDLCNSIAHTLRCSHSPTPQIGRKDIPVFMRDNYDPAAFLNTDLFHYLKDFLTSFQETHPGARDT